MFKTWNSRDPFGIFAHHLLFAEDDGGGEGGTGGGAGGAGDGQGGGDGTPPKGEKTVPQSEVDRILKERLAENTRKAGEDLAKALGVSLEEAKTIIKAHNDRVESEKTDAQKAKEAAEAAKAASEAATAAAAVEKHNALVERRLLRALPNDLFEGDKDAESKLDARVSKLAKLLDVEQGASAEDIDSAIRSLKEDWSELFGAGTSNGNGNGGGSDPGGKPPKPKGKDAYSKGAERAKAAAKRSSYGFEKTNS